MKRSSLFAILVFSCMAIQLHAQKVAPLSSEERAIIEFQDARSLGDGALAQFLHSDSVLVLRRALLAIANIQQSDSLIDYQILRLLSHPRSEIRTAAALAAGQLQSPVFSQGLFTRYAREDSSRVRFALAQAIGKSAPRNYLDSILSAMNAQNDKSSDIEAIFRFGVRNIRSYWAIRYCFENVGSDDPNVATRSLYTLWRILPVPGITDTVYRYSGVLRALLRSPNAEVRMYTAALLGKLQFPGFAEDISKLIQSESATGNWRVLFQSVTAMSTFPNADSQRLETFRILLRHSNDHIKFAALQGLNRCRPETLLVRSASAALRGELDSLTSGLIPASSSIQGEAYVTLATLGLLQKSDLKHLEDGSRDPIVRAKLVEAVSISRALPIPTFMELLADPDNRVAMSAWGFLSGYVSGFGIKDSSEIASHVIGRSQQIFQSNCIPIVTVASAALIEPPIRRFLHRKDIQEYIVPLAKRSFTALDAPDADETLTGILAFISEYADASDAGFLLEAASHPSLAVSSAARNALKTLGITDTPSPSPKQHSVRAVPETDWAKIERLRLGHPKMRIRTEKGEILIRLLPDNAPFTVLSIVRLAEKGFFNGLTFHRVVPNFVIQGGDPLGVGMGGPGYSVRTEVSEITFERGAVGMASAGKDTEGSQFFITHSAAYHLDGRYTVWGVVEEGMDVVDAVQIGDHILEILVLW